MIHFLIGFALCIFIGERLVHYWIIWRLHREERRELRRIEALYTPAPPIELPTISPPPVWLAAFLVVVMIVLAAFLATHA